MTSSAIVRRLAIGAGALALLAGCSDRERDRAEPPAAEAPPAPAAAPETTPPVPTLPAVDVANAEQFVTDEGDRLETLTFDTVGEMTVEGVADGAVAPIYAVPVAAGQTLTAKLESSSSNIYFNVSDAADHSGAALFRGEVEGEAASLTAPRDMTYVLTPFQPRASARRGETAPYRLTVARN
ncbi:hypothetical protein [Phenylobacterium sp.]|uniref:hypothetical protein n=1 Tax=Phenylobacterium sp. TaxID=1871053 RepID=UPI0027311041|nr:hypothetical protein [Phenylobacterium sp.]MDP1615735.1 hypothetical protein [Phenylobacterium sp.]MDP1988575.1 hypothetical protein [Phenylobacterium sp.]